MFTVIYLLDSRLVGATIHPRKRDWHPPCFLYRVCCPAVGVVVFCVGNNNNNNNNNNKHAYAGIPVIVLHI